MYSYPGQLQPGDTDRHEIREQLKKIRKRNPKIIQRPQNTPAVENKCPVENTTDQYTGNVEVKELQRK